MRSQNISGALLHFLELVADLCILSVYWLICCLPVLTIFSSCAALYFTAVHVLRNEKGTVTETFFETFRKKLKPGIALSLVFVLGCGLFAAYLLFGQNLSPEGGIYLAYWGVVAVLALIFMGAAILTCAIFARFKLSFKKTIQTGFYLSLGYPIRIIGALVLLAGTGFLLLHAPMLALVLPAAYALLVSRLLEPVLIKHSEKKREEPPSGTAGKDS